MSKHKTATIKNNTNNSDDDYEEKAFPYLRNLVVDAGYLDRKRHIVHGLLEVDVTTARQLLNGRSFTAYLVACLGRAIAKDPSIQAYRNWRGKLIVFHNVDVVTLIEPTKNAIAVPHIIRNANQKSVSTITEEIRTVQHHPDTSGQSNNYSMRVAARMPRCLRMLAYWWIRQSALRRKHLQGTAVVTSIGMFGKTGGYGIAFLGFHTLGMTVGGISKRPVLDDDDQHSRIEHEFLNLTISFDHDVVDGAPAARFTQTLVETIESAELLRQDTKP